MTARKYDPTCSYPGCGRPHNSHGLCTPHDTMRRYGEELRPILNRTGPIAKSPIERFSSRMTPADNGCIIWTGGLTSGGYGSFTATTTRGSERKEMAHRWIYEYQVGPIPHGYDIDHLCRNRACVNVAHLEPVTRQENILRAAAIKTHCPAGHEYSDENTLRNAKGHRKCKTCTHARDAARAATKNERRRERRKAMRSAA